MHLVLLACGLLTHMVITDGRSAQGRQSLASRRSTADLQNELRRLVWDDLTKYRHHFSSNTEVIKELQQLLVAELEPSKKVRAALEYYFKDDDREPAGDSESGQQPTKERTKTHASPARH